MAARSSLTLTAAGAVTVAALLPVKIPPTMDRSAAYVCRRIRQIRGEERIEQTVIVAAFIRDWRRQTPVFLLRRVEQSEEARLLTTSRMS